MEFVVKMTCESCVAKVEDKLKNKEGIDNVVVDLKQNTVVVESSLPSSQVFNMIKETGLKSAFRGYGGIICCHVVHKLMLFFQSVILFIRFFDCCIYNGIYRFEY